MKQLVNELNDSLGKSAYATEGLTGNSIFVYPRPDFDFISQVVIEKTITFCRNHHLHFFISLAEGRIYIYEPEIDSLSID